VPRANQKDQCKNEKAEVRNFRSLKKKSAFHFMVKRRIKERVAPLQSSKRWSYQEVAEGISFFFPFSINCK